VTTYGRLRAMTNWPTSGTICTIPPKYELNI